MILAITGHRPDKLGGFTPNNEISRIIMEQIDRAFLNLRPEKIIVGMAQGVDQWAAQLAVWNGIPFDAAIPFRDFHHRWPMDAQMKYRDLLSKARSITIVCEGDYASWKMQARNEWMVDRSDRVLAVFDGTSGGTANCVRYARSVGKPLTHINPDSFIPNRHNQEVPRTVGERSRNVIIRPAADVLRNLPIEVRRSNRREREVEITQEESPGVRRLREDARRRMEEDRVREEQERRREEERAALREVRRLESERREAEAAEKSRLEEEEKVRKEAEEEQKRQDLEAKKDSLLGFGRVLDFDL